MDARLADDEQGDGLREFLAYHRRMFFFMAAVCTAAVLALYFLAAGLGVAGGFALGAAAQLAKFALLDPLTIKRIAIEMRPAATVQLQSTLFSLILFGLAAAACLKLDFSVWALAAGIFAPRILLLADTYVRPSLYRDKGMDEGTRPKE